MAPKLDYHSPLRFLNTQYFFSPHTLPISQSVSHWATEPFYLIRSIQPPAVETAAVSAICLSVLPSSSPVGSALSKFHYEMAGSTRGCSLRLLAWHVTGWGAYSNRGRPEPPHNFGNCITFVEQGQDVITDGSARRTRKHTIPKEGQKRQTTEFRGEHLVFYDRFKAPTF